MSVAASARSSWTQIWMLRAFLLASLVNVPTSDAQEVNFDPILQVDAGGHTSRVMSVCFNSAGDELWSAGWDKTVRLWKRSTDGRWTAQPQQTIYLPLGPGRNGVIDNIAISPNDRYLAIGGYSRVTQAAKFSQPGVERPLSAEQLLDQGAIYIYDRVDQSLKRLLGHRGPVRRLVFDAHSQSPRLASAGFETVLDAGGLRIGGGLRLWDIEQLRQLAGVENLPRPVDPTLCFLPSAAGTRVMTNWGDGKAYLWNTQNVVPTEVAQGSQLLAHSRRGSWIVTGGVDTRAAGQLAFWDASEPGGLRPLPAATTALASEAAAGDQLNFLPLVALAFEEKVSQKEYLAVATLVWKAAPNNRSSQAVAYQLRTFEVAAPSKVSREVSRIDLWPVVGTTGLGMPSLAGSEAANTLAVSNGSDGEISIFKLDELVSGRPTRAVLNNRLVPMHKAGFVVRGAAEDRKFGLALQSAAGQSFVLDITANELRNAPSGGWENFDASVSNWKVQGSNATGYMIVGGNAPQRLQLPTDATYLSSLFVPSAAASQPPWLLVAGEEKGQPLLGVFNPLTGELVRLLTGHTNRILQLASTRDGRFVASTSADHTVALWDFSRPGEIIPRHSALRSIALSQKPDGVVVETAPPTTGLAAGDKLLGTVEGQNLMPWSSDQQVHDVVWNRQPGSSLTVRVQRGAKLLDVKLVVHHAVEERKPLCQAMFIQAAAGPEWIVWSPLGYYDVSSLDVRPHLGWLFNPDASESARVNFVGTDKYPKLFAPRLLEELWLEPLQDLSKISLRRMNPAFDLVIAKPTSPRPAADGSRLFESPPEVATLALTNEFPIEMLETPELFLDGKSIGNMVPQGFSAWRAPPGSLEKVSPGAHTLLAKTTARGKSRFFETELKFQFVPPPPSIALVNPIAAHTKEASLPLLAEVRSRSANLTVDAVLEKLDDNNGVTVIKRWLAAETLTVDVPLGLTLGVNRFRLSTAYTIDPKENAATTSAGKLELLIERHALDSSPPEFAQMTVSAPKEGWPAPQPTDARKSSYVVPYDAVVLQGKIAAAELLSEAKLGEELFQQFQPKTGNTFEFTSPVQLKPGMNRFALSAATVGNGSAKEQLIVEYQPPLPDVRIEFPQAGYEIAAIQTPPQIQMVLGAEWEEFTQGANVDVLVNGQSAAEAALTDKASTSFECMLPLQLGKNDCQVRINGITDGSSQTLAITFDYLPAPEVTSVSLPEKTREPHFELIASGRSAAEIDRVLLDQQEVPREQWQATFDGANFTLKVRASILDEDSKNRSLTVYSRDLPNPASRQFIQPTNLGPIKPPTLAWVSPTEGTALTASTARVSFEVHSDEPLTRLLFNDLEVADGDRVIRAPGVYVVQRNVSLGPGENRFRISAENAGGSGAKELVLQRLLPPGYVQAVSIQMADKSVIRPAISSDTDWHFEKALPTGKELTLHFTVKNEQPGEVWVAVNGFRRRAVMVPAGSEGGQANYQCPVVLTRDSDNVIDILPTLPTAQVSRTRVKLDCLSPARPKQRLHLALIGIGVTDEQGFINSAIGSLSGSDLRRTDARLYEFKASAFESCYAYGPYAGNEVSRGIINYVLTNDIPNHISQRAGDPLVQDVVLFYYRGGEQVSHAGEFYLTTQTQNPALDAIMRSPRWLQNRAISSTYLSGVMNELQGAHVMMLDVARMEGEPSGAVPVVSSFAPNAATYRFAWTRPNVVPNDARLMTALNGAFQRADNLGKIEQELGREHAQLSTRYSDAIRYEHKTPAALRTLVMRK